MRNVLAASGLVALLACTGGGGELPDQGPDQADQGGGIHRLPGQAVSSSSSSSEDERGGSNPPSSATTNTPAQNPYISSAEFGRTCNYDSDCVAVFQGFTCQTCKCPNDAIAAKDRSNYDQKLAERMANCPAQTDVQCSPCPNVTATCDTQSKQCKTTRN
jgi:hypothetical protein